MRTDTDAGTELRETEPWPDGTEHVVVIHKEIQLRPEQYREVVEDADLDPQTKYVYIEPGDELLRGLWHVWSSFGDNLAALNEYGERLDRRSHAERTGYVDAERTGYVDAEPAIDAFRRVESLEEAFECDECGKAFETQSALNGHMGSHRPSDEDVREAHEDAESNPQADDAAGGTDTPSLTREAVETADADALRDLAAEHGVDPSLGPDRLRVELLDRAEAAGGEA